MTAEQKDSDQTAQAAADNPAPTIENLSHLDRQRSDEETRKIQDINRQISDLEQTLSKVRQSLTSNRTSLEEAIQSTDEKSDALALKLTKALELIKGLEGSHDSLLRKSSLMGIEIQKLSVSLQQDIQATQQTLQTSIEEQASLSRERDNDLTQKTGQLEDQNLQLANALVEKSRQLTNDLEAERQQRSAELAEQNKKQKTLLNDFRQAQSEINATLDSRTTELEQTAKILGERSNLLEATTKSLQIHTEELIASVTLLNTQTTELYEKSEENRLNLLALAGLEKRHFLTLGSGLMFIALAVAGLTYYQTRAWEQQAATNTETSSTLAQLESNLNNQAGTTSALGENTRQMAQTIEQMEGEITALNTSLATAQQKIEQTGQKLEQTERQLEQVDDKTRSVDARIGLLAPSMQFGKDNTLHGQKWLARQPADAYAIELAKASSKDELYRTAQRYGYYLKEELAYFREAAPERGHYVLVYGVFADQAQAKRSLYRMPRFVDGRKPTIKRISELHKAF